MSNRNPADDSALPEHPKQSLESAQALAARLRERWPKWAQTTVAQRTEKLRALATELRKRKPELAQRMAKEMGKPVREGGGEVEKCAWVCEYYAEHAQEFLSPTSIETDAARSYILYQPLGVVLAIMPWNFPFWQLFRFAAPAFAAGNTCVLKHASNVQGCAKAIEKLVQEATGRSDLLVNVTLDNDNTLALIDHPSIAAVTFTGSTRAGKAIAKSAGAALKKSVLELGGSDPYVVLDDAHLEAAATACVNGRMINTGQSCIAAKRLIVTSKNIESFTKLVIEKMHAKVVGNPLDETTEVGPMARTDLRDELHEQVRKSVEQGATLVLGGEVPDKPGAWYPPTVLTGVGPGMPAYYEELFGPVACIIEAKDEADAIRIANDTSFGLGSAVFSRDLERAEKIAAQMEAGACFVNDFVRSDPRLPFGGVKCSGYGRELASFGMHEFVNIKTVYVKGATA